MARQLAAAQLPPGSKLAVLPLREDREKSPSITGRRLADKLTNELANIPSFTLLERTRVDDILDELKLSDPQEQIVDPEFRKQFFGLSGANYLLVGSIYRLKTHVEVNVRIIDTLKGTIVRSASANIAFGPDGELATAAADGTMQSHEGINVLLRECRFSGRDVLCFLELSLVNSPQRISIRPTSSLAVAKRMFRTKAITIGDVSAPEGVNASKTVEAGDAVAIALRFSVDDKISPVPATLTLELQTTARAVNAFTFRDQPLLIAP